MFRLIKDAFWYTIGIASLFIFSVIILGIAWVNEKCFTKKAKRK